MEEYDIYGNDWQKHGTVVHSLGIIIAPEAYTAPSNICLSGGQVVVKGTKYFSWSTADILVRSQNVPLGWRMPTIAECKVLENYHAGGKFGELVFGLDGIVGPNDMARYTYAPSWFPEKNILFKGKEGYYWTCDRDPNLYPYAVAINNSGLKAGCVIYSNYGLPFVLVKDL